MQDYFITVARGLLDAKHIKRMQVNRITSAIWLYLWILDKMTRIDESTKTGFVLGGKPIKLKEIPIYQDIKCRRKALRHLQKVGYISLTKTPYGQIIKVTKAKKIFGQRSGGGKRQVWGWKTVGLGVENGRSNKDNTVRQYNKTIQNYKNFRIYDGFKSIKEIIGK